MRQEAVLVVVLVSLGTLVVVCGDHHTETRGTRFTIVGTGRRTNTEGLNESGGDGALHRPRPLSAGVEDVYHVVDVVGNPFTLKMCRLGIQSGVQPYVCPTFVRELFFGTVLRMENILKFEMAFDCMQTADHTAIVESDGETRNLCLVFQPFDMTLNEFMEDLGNIKDTTNRERIIRSIVRDVLEVLGYLHKQGVVHRNLNLDSIYLDFPDNPAVAEEPPVVKLGDWGLAISSHTPRRWISRGGLLPNMPPDSTMGSQAYSHSLDMWQLGKIVAELFMAHSADDTDRDLFALRPYETQSSDPFQGMEGCNPFADALRTVFSVLGIPDVHLADRPWFRDLITKLAAEPFPAKLWANHALDLKQHMESLGVTPDGMELLRGLLQYHPRHRLSAEQALSRLDSTHLFNAATGQVPAEDTRPRNHKEEDENEDDEDSDEDSTQEKAGKGGSETETGMGREGLLLEVAKPSEAGAAAAAPPPPPPIPAEAEPPAANPPPPL